MTNVVLSSRRLWLAPFDRSVQQYTVLNANLTSAPQVESTQSVIRIVGLSATLPNYIDVADFLR